MIMVLVMCQQTYNLKEKEKIFFCTVVCLTFVSHNLVCLQEEAPMLQVHDLTLQLVLHHINQSQLIAQVLFVNREKQSLHFQPRSVR